MGDKQASPQIIDLFEAIKATLHTASRHMPNERSVGNVPAPRADAELVEKQATSKERARCAAIARKLLSMWRVDSQDLRDTVAAIENGDKP